MSQIIRLDNRISGYYDVSIPSAPIFESDIINGGLPVSEQYWRPQSIPKFKGRVEENKWWEKEQLDCYEYGKWVAIKGDLHWLPPDYLFFLNHWKIDGQLPEFRMKSLRHSLFEKALRDNESYIGSFTVKNRRDGATIKAMCRTVHKALPAEFSKFGIQSTDLKAVKEVCWYNLMIGFKRLNKRWKMNSDGSPIWQGSTDVKTKLVFKRAAQHISAKTNMFDLEEYDDDQDTEIGYAASGTEGFDGRKMAEIDLDEWLKWVDTDPLQALSTYKDCVMLGRKRVGFLNIFSSPVEKKSKYTEDLFEFWQMCNPQKLDPKTGVTKTKIGRWFSDPLEGIESFYDKYGMADADEVREYILATRAALPKHRRLAEVRKFPLSEEEAFSAYDNTAQWANKEGIEERYIYLLGTKHKDEVKKEPKFIIGSLHWPDQVPDSGRPFFQPAADEEDFTATNRFAFAYVPRDLQPLRNIYKPPKIIESMIGIDPYDYRNPNSKTPSMGAGIQFQFGDMGYNQERRHLIPSMYYGRPHPNVFYEDMIKFALFTGSLIQTEDKNRNIIDYFEDRGYMDWLMPKDMWGDPERKGNSPNVQSGFMDSICALIDAYFSQPIALEKYNLETVFFQQLLKDVLDFNRDDTHKNDITMALGQALFGAQKWLARHKKRIPHSQEFADALAGCLF